MITALLIIGGAIGWFMVGSISTAVWEKIDSNCPPPLGLMLIAWPVFVPVGILGLFLNGIFYIGNSLNEKNIVCRIFTYPYRKTRKLLNPSKRYAKLPKAIARDNFNNDLQAR